MTNPRFSAYGSDQMCWIEDPAAMGLRLVGLAHEVSPAGYAYSRNAVEHTGWFLSEDNWTGETVAGVVYQLPGKNGRARYVVGYADPYNDGPACLDLGNVIEGERKDSDWEPDLVLREATIMADYYAEKMAEEEREYQAAWQAGCDAREKAGEALEACRRWKEAVKASFAVFRNRRNIPRVDVRLLFKAQSEDARDYWDEFRDAREAFHTALDIGYHDADVWREAYNNG